MSFREYLRTNEETTSGDIASVPSKLGTRTRHKHLEKGKKCKRHKQVNCEVCEEERLGGRYD